MASQSNLLKAVLEGFSVDQQKAASSVSSMSLAATESPFNDGQIPKSNSALMNPSVQKIIPLIQSAQESEKAMTELIEALKQLDPAQLLPLLDFFEGLQQKGLLNRDFMPKLLNSKLEQIEQQFFTNTSRQNSERSDGGDSAVSPSHLHYGTPFPSPVTPATPYSSGHVNGSGLKADVLVEPEPPLFHATSGPVNGGFASDDQNQWKPMFSSSSVEMTLNNENKLRAAMGFDPTPPKRHKHQGEFNLAVYKVLMC